VPEPCPEGGFLSRLVEALFIVVIVCNFGQDLTLFCAVVRVAAMGCRRSWNRLSRVRRWGPIEEAC
jgi:hypothetical protein